MQDFILRMGVSFSNDEKERAIPTACRILDLSDIARKNGILGLESECLNDGMFLRLGIELIVNGADPEFVEKTLQHFILSSGYKGTDLLQSLLIAEGLLLIPQGYHRSMIAHIMGAMLGEKHFTTIIEYARKVDDDCFYSLFPAGKAALPESAAFDQELLQSTDEELTMLLMQNISSVDLAIALKTCSSSLAERIRSRLSDNLFMGIAHELNHVGAVSLEDVLKAQAHILECLARVKSMK